MKQLTSVLCISLLLLAGSAKATTWVVKPDSTGDFITIKAAIDSPQIVNGDTIALTNGIFKGAGNRDIDYNGKAITIRSQSGNPDSCVIDCEGAGRGFYFHSGEGPESVLERVKVTNGYAVYGGGIYCIDDSSPIFTNCTISDNSAEEHGGVSCFFLPRPS